MSFKYILYVLLYLFNSVFQSKCSLPPFQSQKEILKINQTLFDILKNQNCVEVSVGHESEYEILTLLEDLNNLNIPIVVKNKYLNTLFDCNTYIFIITNSSGVINLNFKKFGLTERNKTLVFIQSQNENWLSQDYIKTFGYARVVVVTPNTIQVLDSPSLTVRKFRKIFIENGQPIFGGEIESKNYVRGGVVKVATFNCPLFCKIDNKTGNIHGIEAELVKEVARQLNQTILVVPLLESNYSNFGYRLPNGTWVGGVMASLHHRIVDLGFCALWLSYDRDKDVEQTMPWGRVDLTFLVPRPRLSREHWHTIFLPFHIHTWAAVAASFALATVCHWLLLKTSYFITVAKNDAEFSAVVLGMFGVLTQCSGMISRGRPSALVLCWYVTCVILVALYSSNIVSRLTLPLYTERIDSVKQLVQKGFIWGQPFVSNNSNLLNLQDYWHRKFAVEHFRMLKRGEMHRLIMSGKFAFSVQALEKYYVFSSDFYRLQDSELKSLRVMRDVTNQFMITIQIVRGSPLYPVWNLQIQWMMALGLVHYWKRDTTRRHNPSLMLQLMQDLDPSPLVEHSPLALDSFQGAFLMLFIGLALATFVFLCELYRGKNNIKN